MDVKELKAPERLRVRLRKEKEILLTNSGKPMAVLFNTEEGDDPE